MAAIKDNLLIEQGATFKRSIKWFESDEITPVNLTDFTARMHIRSDIDSDIILVTLTDLDGITLGGAAGTIVLNMNDTVTSALAFTEGVYDLELENTVGFVTRLTYGGVKVSPEVTR